MNEPLRDTIANRPEWQSLPGGAYRDPGLFEAEMTGLWNAAWLFACPSCEAPSAGDYVTVSVGDASILVLRDEGGFRAFHNVCSHRGTTLCDQPSGRVGQLIVCPYHQWAFNRRGDLHSCRGMGDAADRASGLQPVAVHEVAGLVFVSLASSPPPTDPLDQAFGAAEPHGFADAKVAHAIDYTVAANWKLVWENNRECYHCDVGHPQYVKANFDIAEAERATPASRAALQSVVERSAAYWEAEGLSIKHTESGLARFPAPEDPNPFPVSATRTVQVAGYETESMDGKRVAPLMGRLGSPDSGVLRLRSIPSFWCHASCDHAVLTRVLPIDRRRTATRVTWLVRGDAEEGRDYTLDRLLPFWQLTSEQDWALCERAATGVASPAYRPGPLSPNREYNLEAFLRWYAHRVAVSR